MTMSNSVLAAVVGMSSLIMAISANQVQADQREKLQWMRCESTDSRSNANQTGLQANWHQWWHGDPRRGRYGYMTRFGTFDTNHDGVVSAEEASANAEKVLASMDVNEDDQVSFDEFMVFRMGNRNALIKKRQAVRYAINHFWFVRMDADEDELISRIEFFEAASRHFSDSDANKDGKVTPIEFRSQRGIF